MGFVLHIPAIFGQVLTRFYAGHLPISPAALHEDLSPVLPTEASGRLTRRYHDQGRRRLASRGLSDHLLRDLGL